ncbi:phage major capsid protein [Sinomonas sp. B1-1]|uniref:phage major capsid protein n=1 Tax=Sinomonas sp. B1-1 TaxID=3141454 RepID=UPI003D2D7660
MSTNYPRVATSAEARNRIRTLARKALDVVEDPELSPAQKKAQVAPLEDELKHYEAEAQNLAHLEAERGRYLRVQNQIVGATAEAGGFTVERRALDGLQEALASKTPYQFRLGTKTTSSDAAQATNLLQPAEYDGQITELRREPNRILDRIPTTTMGAPSVEFLVHGSTSGAATTVAAGGLKPEITPNTVRTILTAKKIAAFTAANDEALADFPGMLGFLNNELLRAIVDAENSQILSGDGTGENLLGLLNTSGILTRAYGAGSETQKLDTLDLAITDLRNGAAYTEPDLVILHPTTWSGMRRTKDSQGRYLLNPNPAADEANTIWGLPVLVTTQIAAGTGIVANMREATRAFLRESISVKAGFPGDFFQRNLTGFVAEERLALGVKRPAAIVKVTGL